MGCEWNRARLKNCVIGIVDNRGKTPPLSTEVTQFELVEVNAVVGSIRNPNYNAIRKYVTSDTYENWFRSGHPEKGDILFSTVGSIAEVAVSDGRGCIAQNLIALKPDNNVIDPSYLYYYLSCRSTQETLRMLDISSVQPHAHARRQKRASARLRR